MSGAELGSGQLVLDQAREAAAEAAASVVPAQAPGSRALFQVQEECSTATLPTHPASTQRMRHGQGSASPSLGTFVPQDLDETFYLRAPQAPHLRRMLAASQLLCSEPPETW